MKTAFLTVAAVFAAVASRAADNPAATALESLHFSQLPAAPARSAGVEATAQDRLTQIHLIPDGGNGSLIGWADSQAQFEEAVAMWTPILRSAGLRPGKAEFKEGTYTIAYESPNGLVLRRFMANPKQFKPKDEAALRANRDLIVGSVRQHGVPVVASYVVAVDGMLPTYAVYYLTKSDASRELGVAERRLRLLGRGEDIDFDLLEAAGVNILQKPEPWIMVYYGPAIGFVSGLAKTREGAEKLLADRLQYFREQHKALIGSRIHELEPDPSSEYRYLVNVYVYQ